MGYVLLIEARAHEQQKARDCESRAKQKNYQAMLNNRLFISCNQAVHGGMIHGFDAIIEYGVGSPFYKANNRRAPEPVSAFSFGGCSCAFRMGAPSGKLSGLPFPCSGLPTPTVPPALLEGGVVVSTTIYKERNHA